VKEARPLLVMPEELSCPISLELMTDPVVADDGNTYQRAAIEAWVHKCTAGKERHRGSVPSVGTICITLS
jgi:hypothetical protein